MYKKMLDYILQHQVEVRPEIANTWVLHNNAPSHASLLVSFWRNKPWQRYPNLPTSQTWTARLLFGFPGSNPA
jgi:hypothetical protein